MDTSWTYLGHVELNSLYIRLFFLSASWTKSFLAGISIRKYERESSVSIVALGEPFSLSFFCIVGLPVALPSVKSNSLKKYTFLCYKLA